MSKLHTAFKLIDGPIKLHLLEEQTLIGLTYAEAGAQCSFMGQIRADYIGEDIVKAIDYTAYEAMALKQGNRICLEVAESYGLIRLIAYHSIGMVSTGEICLLVYALAPRRKAAMNGCQLAVERIKQELPIWGKELTRPGFYQWKVNTDFDASDI